MSEVKECRVCRSVKELDDFPIAGRVCKQCRAERETARRNSPDFRQPTYRPEYAAWKNMKTRCYNENHNEYHRYGGRGITVCDRWRNSFEAFYADMGSRPSSFHSIDRRNNDGNYEPDNCRWATKSEQRLNSSRIRFVEYDGARFALDQICKMKNISRSMVAWRLDAGWSVKEAIDIPSGCSPSLHGRFLLDGQWYTIAELAKMTGMHYSTILARLAKQRLSVKEAVSSNVPKAFHWDGMEKTLTEWSSYLGIPRPVLHQRINIYGWTAERAFTQPVGIRNR
jgi:hypothetical protein